MLGFPFSWALVSEDDRVPTFRPLLYVMPGAINSVLQRPQWFPIVGSQIRNTARVDTSSNVPPTIDTSDYWSYIWEFPKIRGPNIAPQDSRALIPRAPPNLQKQPYDPQL